MVSIYLHDFLRMSAAVIAFAPLLLVPGFLFAHATGIFDFARQTLRMKLALGGVLSLAITPILLFALWSISISLVVAFYFALLIAGLWLVFRFRAEFTRIAISRTVVLVLAAWFMLAAFALIDLPFRGGLNVNSSANPDLGFRVELVQQIAHTEKLPPAYPFLAGPERGSLRYYYFWFMTNAVLPAATNWTIGARDTLNAGIVWLGWLLLALIAVFWKFFFDATQVLKKTLAAIPILLLGGLQVLVFTLDIFTFHHEQHRWFIPQSSITFTLDHTGHIPGWFVSLMWVPHHVAGVLAALVAALALYCLEATHGENSRTQKFALAVLAVLAIASGIGLSTFAVLPFLVFFLLLTIYLLVTAPKQGAWWRLALIGVSASLFVAPFLLAVRAPAGSAEPPLRFEIRRTAIADRILDHLNHFPAAWAWGIHLFAMPFVFFFQLGILSIVAVWAGWRITRKAESADKLRNRLVAAFVLTTIALVMTVRSVGYTNDFGWRSPMGALFLLLFFAVDFFDGWRFFLLPSKNSARPWLRYAATALVLIGFSSIALEYWLLRFTRAYEATPTEAAHRTDLRRAAEFLEHNSSPTAIVQAEPSNWNTILVLMDVERGTALLEGTQNFNEHNHVPAHVIAQAESAVYPIFWHRDLTASQLHSSCRAGSIDFVVVQYDDQIYRDPGSWIWRITPSYANNTVRIFDCR